MLLLWIILYGAISLFGFGCAVLFLIREDYEGMIIFLIIGLFMGILTYSAIQGRREKQGKAVAESKIANRFIQIFFFLFFLLLGLGGIAGGITFLITAKETFDYAYGAFGIFMGLAFLSNVRNMLKKARQKLKETTGAKTKDTSPTSNKKAGIFSKKSIWLAVGIIILAGLAFFLFKPSSEKDKALQEFDFPVWALRTGDITVFQQEKYFSDSSERNIVVGNVGEQTQENIKISQKLPISLAESADDLKFNIQPNIISQKDPFVLEFEIKELAPQKSQVIKISSKKNLSQMEKLCSGAKIRDCASHTQELIYTLDAETRTKYQAQAEPVANAYTGKESNITAATKQFIDQTKQNSLIAIAAAKDSESGPIEKIYVFFTDLVEKIKEIKGIGTDKKSEPPKSTALNENFFAKNFTQVWVLSKTEDVPAESIICRAAAPLKAMNGKYDIPQAYLKGATASKKTSQIIQISVFDSMENREKALKGCTGQDARIASGYRVEIKFRDQMGFDVKRFMAVQDNYLIVIPGTSGPVISYVAPAWDEFFFRQTVLPAIRQQIKSNY